MRNLFPKCLQFKRHNDGFQQSRRRQVLNISNRSPAKKMLGFTMSHSAVLAISAVICSIGTVKPQRIICKQNHMKTLSLAGRSNSSVSLFSPIARTISRRGRLACAKFPTVHPKCAVPRSRWFRRGLFFPHSGHYPTGSPSSADCVWVLCLPYSSLLSCFLVIIIP